MVRDKIFFLLLYTLVSSCSPQVITGWYDTDQAYVMSMTGEMIEFQDNQQFFYKTWSDDIDHNKKGKGRYEIKDKTLHLTFTAYPPEETLVDTRVIEASSTDSLLLQLHVQNHAGEPLLGVTVRVEDEAGTTLDAGISNTTGNCVLQLPHAEADLYVVLFYIGYLETRIGLDGGVSQSVNITMAERTQYFAAGTQHSFRIKNAGDRLILSNEQGKKILYKVSIPN